MKTLSTMKTLSKWLGIVIVVLVMAIGLLSFGARYHDGPLAIFTGGPFTSGEIVPASNDWNILRDSETVEFQTLDPLVSRTVWLVVYDGRLFFTSGYFKWDEDHGLREYGLPGLISRLSKPWPYQLETDNRIILRIDDKLYERRLQQVTSRPEIVPVLDAFNDKYGDSMGIGAAEVTQGYTRMYEVVGR